MRILFAGKQHYDVGGVPASTEQLSRRLVRAGHRVAGLAAPPLLRPRAPDVSGTLQLESDRGYEAYSLDGAPEDGLAALVATFRPDVLVVDGAGRWSHDWTRALVSAAPRSLPVVLYVRDHEAMELLGDRTMRVELVVANAAHHAVGAPRDVTAVVVPSVVEPGLYLTESTGETVLFINPVLTKGVETAFAIAEGRPDVPFEFRQSWHIPDDAASSLAARGDRLGNVRLLPATADPHVCYGRARVLLAPYEDMGRPRVVAEAQISGIPVVARDDPPLREAVGAGGILVPPHAPIAEWLRALGALFDDPVVHHDHAVAARAHSQRDEMRPERVTDRFVAALAQVVRQPAARSRGDR